MSMTNFQKNIASQLSDLALVLLEAYPEAKNGVALYTTEAMSGLSDSDYQELVELAHITVTEMTAAKGAFDAFVTYMGDPATAGTNAYKLLKIVKKIP